MEKIEYILFKGKTIAIIVRQGIVVEGVKFFTTPQDFLQLGFHVKKKGITIPTHYHKIEAPIPVLALQEVLYIQKGKIRITFYTVDGEQIEMKELNTGDTIIILHEAHKIEILRDAKILEVKQGPYLPGAHTNLKEASS